MQRAGVHHLCKPCTAAQSTHSRLELLESHLLSRLASLRLLATALLQRALLQQALLQNYATALELAAQRAPSSAVGKCCITSSQLRVASWLPAYKEPLHLQEHHHLD